jgi:hypothetical protein
VTISFNVQHAPMGAFSSFTMGHFGTGGGFGSEVGRPARDNLFIGFQRQGQPICYFPFVRTRGREEGAEGAASLAGQADRPLGDGADGARVLGAQEITRAVGWASDGWEAHGFSLSLLSPFFAIPDPERAAPEELARASCPAVFAVLRVDNRGGQGWMKGFLATDGLQLRDLESTSEGGLVGVAARGRFGMACRPAPGAAAFLELTPADGLAQAGRRLFRFARTGGIVVEAAPGELREVVVALGFFNPGVVTTGLPASYWYTRYFGSLEEVLGYALDGAAFYRGEAAARDRELAAAPLNEHQKFLIAHATHSYWGATQWLDRGGGRPLWVVTEGEYEMMNTLDLAIDQVFLELRFAPWAVRNVLELFVERYAYRDEVRTPGGPGALGPGGLSFCHDQGISGQFAPAGCSAYECRDLPGTCFSYMTAEELVNWICIAGVYFARTRDVAFLRRHQAVLGDCLASLLNRDDPDPARRDGMIDFDSARTGSGAEITTYDSLDHSLSLARGSLYLAGKCWAAHLALEHLFRALEDRPRADEAAAAARLCARAIASRWDDALGYIPATLDGRSRSAIIPAIEGLLYPSAMGLREAVSPDGPDGDMVAALRRHFQAVFRPGLCQFADGGWKLSSTSDNSWMSKIALCQHVARAVLGIDFGEAQAAHDRAHADWQRRGGGYWAACDQMAAGVAIGSRFYPRLVTTLLWLEEPGRAP